MEPTVEEENIIRTIDEDVGLPPSNYQEAESEGQQVATETPEHIVDALDDRNPTPLPPLESTRRRTLKRIQVDERLNSIEGTLSKRSIAYQTQQILNKYFDSKCDGDKCKLFFVRIINP